MQFSIANIAMIIALWFGLQWFDGDAGAWMRILMLALLCIVGAATYAVVLLLVGFRPRHLRP
jgi:putative peptidoglycan lipid II flippase